MSQSKGLNDELFDDKSPELNKIVRDILKKQKRLLKETNSIEEELALEMQLQQLTKDFMDKLN